MIRNDGYLHGIPRPQFVFTFIFHIHILFIIEEKKDFCLFLFKTKSKRDLTFDK